LVSSDGAAEVARQSNDPHAKAAVRGRAKKHSRIIDAIDSVAERLDLPGNTHLEIARMVFLPNQDVIGRKICQFDDRRSDIYREFPDWRLRLGCLLPHPRYTITLISASICR
jgi:hypothetical protein